MNSFSISKVLGAYSSTSHRSEPFAGLIKRLSDTQRNYTYKSPYHFISFLSDKAHIENVNKIWKEKDSSELKTIFIAGIGGANLAFKTLIDAFPPSRDRNFVFLDNISESEVDKLNYIADRVRSKQEFLLMIISKSGTTIETIANGKFVFSIMEKKFGSVSDRVVVLTEKASPLWQWAQNESVSSLELKSNISDRFSAFSPSCALPMLFANLSLSNFYKGALDALALAQMKGGKVFDFALAVDGYIHTGMHANLDMLFFSSELETFGKWHRQLIAESLGKSKDFLDKIVDRSISPSISVGTTDLHSMLELYLAQPNERLTWFFKLGSHLGREVSLSEEVKGLLPGIRVGEPGAVLDAIYKSVVEVYEKKSLPFVESVMDSISEQDFGFHMMNAMLFVLGLAHLWNIDAFNQPEVEEYKENARKILTEQ